MPLSWPCITRWMPCSGQQLLCRHKEMATRFILPKPAARSLQISLSEVPLPALRQLCSCHHCHPAAGPGRQQEVALGQGMLWGHPSLSQSCCFLFQSPSPKSLRQCTNCASICSCGNKSSAFLFPGTGPCLLCTAFPATSSLGSSQRWVRLTSTPSHERGRSWAVQQNTPRSGSLIVESPGSVHWLKSFGFGSLGRKGISLFVLGRCQQDNGKSSECCATEILPTSPVSPRPEQPGDEGVHFLFPQLRTHDCSWDRPSSSAAESVGKGCTQGPSSELETSIMAAALQGRGSSASLQLPSKRRISGCHFWTIPKGNTQHSPMAQGMESRASPQGSISTTEHPCSTKCPLFHSEMYTGQTTEKSSLTPSTAEHL